MIAAYLGVLLALAFPLLMNLKHLEFYRYLSCNQDRCKKIYLIFVSSLVFLFISCTVFGSETISSFEFLDGTEMCESRTL